MAKRRRRNHRAELQTMRAAVQAVFLKHVVPALDKKLDPFLGEGECLPDLARLAVLIVREVASRFAYLDAAERAKLAATNDLLDAEADVRRQRTQSELARLEILRAWFALALAAGVDDPDELSGAP